MAAAAPASAAQASAPAPARTLPSAVPSAITPAVNDGRVFGIAQNGNVMIIGGTFTQVGGLPRAHVAAFDKTTGALSSFAPNVNGNVNAVLPGPTSSTAYIGGTFTQVNGAAAQFVALVDLTTGNLVTSFKPPAFDFGYVNDMVARGSRLYVGGTFGHAGGKAHAGLVSLNATTGALDPFLNVQLSGHHNDTGTGAQGWVGPWGLDVTADGKTMIVIGNFKYADTVLHDQVVMLDLSGAAAVVSPWNTTRYAPYCYNWAYDSYVRGVSFSPDGSYFVINATGGGHGTLCDATTRFETQPTNTNAQPTWVDETGGDTVWGITVTNTAVYIGGHNRWNNNPKGSDVARAGAVPRPGLAALDPVSGRPFSWNPGRKPLGVAVFAVLSTSEGLWIGSNTDFVGNYRYKRPKIAFFPYAGGSTPASTATAALPATVYLAGSIATPTPPGGSDTLATVAFDGTTATGASANNQGIDFGNWRGAFMVGNKVFYGYTDGYLYSRTFSNNAFGAATQIDPYNDPTWSNIDSGNGTTFRGMVPSLYAQLPTVTGMVYSQGRLYYTLSGDSKLYSRWFTPDSGIMDETVLTASSSVNFSTADGMFVAGGQLYYADRTDGNLRRVAFTAGTVSGTPTVVSGPGVDAVTWKSRALFLSGAPANTAPTAAFTSSCTSRSCSLDGSGSSDSDGTIASYTWDFGDGTTGTAATPSHTYAADGTFTATLTVTDDGGATNAVTNTITVTNRAPTAAITSSCLGLSCTFDGTGSSDSDGTISAYGWDYGDSGNGTAATTSHTYSAAGTYSVKLTVTDNGGTSTPLTKSITVAAVTSGPSFVGSVDAGGGNVKVKQLAIPAAAHAGDTAVAFFSAPTTATWTGPTGVTGWTQVGTTFDSGTLATTVWTKVLAAGDLGATVHFDSATYSHAAAKLVVYSGVDTTTPVAAFAQRADASTASHTTPTAAAGAGDLVVSFWTDRASAARTWTAPAGVTSRGSTTDSGTLTVQALVADSDGPVPAQTYGGRTASTDAATDRAAMWTIVLNGA